ncbi:MAG: CsgG/HfaB family protein [Flavobacteriales bacterium]|jgi:TolB-like protein|nr:CsgG/HfaB family protein [Flavobacteriales bacterium]
MNKLFALLIFFTGLFSTIYGNKVIAISYFDNTTANSKYNSLSKGIADMLITDLSKVRDIDIVEREKLEQLIKEIKLGQSKYFDQSTAQKLGKGLGAASILTGAFYVLDGTIRIDARLINVETGKVMAADEVTGKTSDFFGLHKQLVNLLIQSLKIKYNPKTESLVDYDNKIELKAVVNYSDAISYEDNGLNETASQVLESTLQQYPEFLFAKTKLDKIRAFIEEKVKERERLLLQEVNTFLSNIDTNSESFTKDLMNNWNNMITNYNYSTMIAFNKELRKHKIPQNKKAYEGLATTLGEFMGYYDCLSLYMLKQYQQLIEPSKYFLAQYPTSLYFNSVKLNLNMALKDIEQREEGKKDLKAKLTHREMVDNLAFLNKLGYYGNKRFIRGKTYQKFKKIYIQKILKADKSAFLLFDEYDRFDDVTEFFEIAEENLDKELMIKIKDLAIEICSETDYEDDAYRLEEKIGQFESNIEKHQEKKAKALEDLNSGELERIAKTVKWFWLMRDKKEEQMIIDGSLKYLEMKDNRDDWKIYDTRMQAYENIVEAYDYLGDFEAMKSIVERYRNDQYLLKHKDRDFDSQNREFKEYLRKGPKEYAKFEKDVLNHDIRSNVLIGNADVYRDNYQYIDEIACRKEAIEKYELDDQTSEYQYYFLFNAYGNAGLFEKRAECAKEFIDLYPKSSYVEAIKSILTFSPK